MMYPRGLFARYGRCAALAAAGVFLAVSALICGAPATAQTAGATARASGASNISGPASTPLSRGIALYGAGRNEDALNEFRTVVGSGSSRGRALAFYYAARIRLQMGNLPAARKNLLAARADSAGFQDALGMLAYVNLKMGNRADALVQWRQFVQAAGSAGPGPVTVDSITLPEEYRRNLARAASRALYPAPESAGREPASRTVSPAPPSSAAPPPSRTASAPAVPDTVATAAKPDTVARADSLKNARRLAVGKPDSEGVSLANIDQRIESQIRRGYYGVGVAAVLLLAGLAWTAWWMGRRRRPEPPLTFSATVNRELDEVDLEEGLSPDNESLAEEFERRRMEMEDGPKSKVQSPKREESPTPKAQGPKWEEDPGIRARTPEPEEAEPRPGSIRREPGARIPVSSPREESIFPSFESEDRDTLFRPPAPARPGPGAESGRRPITEEVKALVARMAREGHSAVEIARIADLTRTEVELILAVRAHNVEQLIESAGREEEEALDRGALYRAIGELHAEGRPPQDVARRLGISVAEVNLALAMMEKRGRGRR